LFALGTTSDPPYNYPLPPGIQPGLLPSGGLIVGLATDQAAAGQQAGLNAGRQGIVIWWIRGRSQGEERLVAAALQAGGSQRKFGTVGEVVVIKLFRRFVVEDPETTADRHLALLGGVPGKPDARAEGIQRVIEKMLLARHHTGGNLALEAAAGVGEDHVAHSLISQTVGRIEKVFIAEAQAYGQVGRELPVILYKRRQ